MITIREILKKSTVFAIVLCLPFLVGCSDADNDSIPLTILSIKANGAPLEMGSVKIPINSVIEIAFSSEIIPAKFEALFSVTKESEALDYTISYTNVSSRVTVTLEQMATSTAYNLKILAGDLGVNGSFFNNELLVSFITKTQSNSGGGLVINANTTGSFDFSPKAPLNLAPIKVFYHIPAGDLKKMPILMAFHGAGRNASAQRNYWIQLANEKGFMVIAPEFSEINYPGLGDDYLMANIFDDGDNPSTTSFNSSEEWTFSSLDPIFEAVKVAVSGSQEKYSAWGHSAGAQFLHRFATYLPNSKLDVAVCSNSGWYTVPENTVSFPYGILNGQLPDENIKKVFSKKIIVHLGLNDTNPDGGVRRNTVVDSQQGIHRLERGRYYFNTSKTQAQNRADSFNWELQEVSNIGHDEALMANDAFQYLEASLRVH
ncbi:hypothetical protein PI23P_01962 [Polaribacter irgensii 23-P]|uniref:SbsA Ig-like domain-containing protein n=1 Tax=Polaribacter irgensii 23-P TaxID=313594 RepID=A4BW79_9FLAO|nr:Ig-like domain-containing protein [Polaribacter irgensii]EAR13220.1 hypothetical protein PI23P_01962 [Polaribacter irgensii 23-P]